MGGCVLADSPERGVMDTQNRVSVIRTCWFATARCSALTWVWTQASPSPHWRNAPYQT